MILARENAGQLIEDEDRRSFTDHREVGIGNQCDACGDSETPGQDNKIILH